MKVGIGSSAWRASALGLAGREKSRDQGQAAGLPGRLIFRHSRNMVTPSYPNSQGQDLLPGKEGAKFFSENRGHVCAI